MSVNHEAANGYNNEISGKSDGDCVYYIEDYTVYTLEGKGLEGAYKEEQNVSKALLQPKELKGAALKIDPVTALAAASVLTLTEDRTKLGQGLTGIVIASRYCNHQMALKYGDKVRNHSVSPALYSVSGPNICAGLAAYAGGCKGPTLVLPGGGTALGDLILFACNYLNRKDTDIMIASMIDVNKNGSAGIAVSFKITMKSESTGRYQITLQEGSLKEDEKEKKGEEEGISRISEGLTFSSYMSDALRTYYYLNQNSHEVLHLSSRLRKKICIQQR